MFVYRLVAPLVILLTISVGGARPREFWTLPKLLASSDCIVIAVPVRVQSLEEIQELPNIFSQNKPLRGKGVNTTFEVLGVLKGDTSLKCLVLHHYDWAEPPRGGYINGPLWVWFDPSKETRFLMFLKKEKDGRYAAVSGQVDPALSVQTVEARDDSRLTNRCSGPANSAGR